MRLVFSSDTPEPGSGGQYRTKPTASRQGHAVQFYESDAYFIRVAADFVVAGLQSAETAIVILTPEHRDTLARELSARGVDVDSARRQDELIELDAREALRVFMAQDVPDETQFLEAVLPLLARAGRNGRGIRAVGEMGDILWSEGRGAAALALEERWNKLRETQPVSTLCAHSMRGFGNASDLEFVASICSIHDAAVPTERYVDADERERLVEVVLLQQQAEAMKSERRRRHALETTVHEALIDPNRPPRSRR